MLRISTNTRRARPLLGTFEEIGVADADAIHTEDAGEAALGAVAEDHLPMSVRDADSDVSPLKRAASSRIVAVHPWTHEITAVAAEMNRRSGGAFDIDVAAVLRQRGQPSLAVRAPSSMVADARTKVVMNAGTEAAASPDHHRASAIFVTADGDVHATTNWGVRHHAS